MGGKVFLNFQRQGMTGVGWGLNIHAAHDRVWIFSGITQSSALKIVFPG